MTKYILFVLFFALNVLANPGLPPTSLSGQAQSSKTTAFFLQTPFSQATLVSGPTSLIETGSENILPNPGMEGQTLGWTSSGGGSGASVAPDTGAVMFGKQDMKITSGASGGITVSGPVITVPRGFFGGNGQMYCRFSGSSSTTLTFSITDGVSTTLNTTTFIMPANSAGSLQGVNFTFSSTVASAQLKIVDANANDVFFVDDCFVGPALNLGFSFPATSWTSYTPTFTGFGTVSSSNCRWAIELTDLLLDCTFTVGTPTGVEARVSFPNSFVSASTLPTLSIAGKGVRNVANAEDQVVLKEASVSYVTFGINTSTSAGLSKSTGSNMTNAGNVYSFNARVAIQGIQAQFALAPQQQASSWSGYFDSTCSWARTNAAYGDPTADATCALVQRTNNNFGTVTAVAGLLPGVTFTPNVSGQYSVCALAKAAPNITALAAALGVQMTDGSGNALTESVQTALVTSGYQEFTNCAIITTTAATAYTTKLQTKASAGTITLGGNGGSAVEWVIYPISQGIPTPLITGNVSQPDSTAPVLKPFFINYWGTGPTPNANNCTTGTCAISSSYSGATVTWNSTGNYNVNVPAGTCSVKLYCTGNATISGTGITNLGPQGASTATVFNFQTGSPSNSYGNLNCGCQ